MQQWVSAFVESGLRVSKAVGDLVRPCGFAFFWGLVCLLYSKYSDHISLENAFLASSVLCTICYRIIGFTDHPILGLVVCAVSGFLTGLFWPGTISMAAKAMPLGGTTMFAFIALAGDVGCASGPSLVGFVANLNNINLQAGLRSATIFPILILFAY